MLVPTPVEAISVWGEEPTDVCEAVEEEYIFNHNLCAGKKL